MSFRKLLAPLLILTAMGLTACNNPFQSLSEKVLETKAVNPARETATGGYKLLTVDELKKMTDEGKDILIVDTMPLEDSYNKNHIPGAVQFLFPIPAMADWNMALTGDKSQQDFEALLGPDKNRPIAFYCGFVKCTRSHNGAIWAKKLGYTEVYRVPGGIVAWKDAKFPVQSVK